MKVNYNNYLSFLSWGWLATILHSLYWTMLMYSNNKLNQNENIYLINDSNHDNHNGDRLENEIL